MTEQQASQLMILAQQQMKESFNSEYDVEIGMLWLTVLMHLFGSSSLPISNKKFLEVVRIFCNVLEAGIDMNSKEKK